MKTLVIHPEDKSTDFLSVIYEGKDWTIINYETSRNRIKKEIKAHDRIVMLGHGDEDGLYGFGYHIINRTNAYNLRPKKLVGIWCNANDFFHKHNLKGLYTGMIISEYDEAILYGIYNVRDSIINESNALFAQTMRNAIDNPFPNVLTEIREEYKTTTPNPLIQFNSKNIFHRV